jgi:hypothetical protein
LIAGVLLLLAVPATGLFSLPSGVSEIHAEIKIPDGAHDLKIAGHNTVLRAADDFKGRALLSCVACRNVSFVNFAVDGNRAHLAMPLPIPPSNIAFAAFFANNGILIENSRGILIEHVRLRNIANFPVLVSASEQVSIAGASIRDSGSLNSAGKNNTTGGILLEEGTADFTVYGSSFTRIRGNAVWTHSRYQSRRNGPGGIRNNSFTEIGRDAIQAGHAHDVTVAYNHGVRVGFPSSIVDAANIGIPVAVDTAGDVDKSTYFRNHFEEVNGQCFDLDGFHDGIVSGNQCINRRRAADYPFGHYGIVLNNANPDMQSRNIRIMDNYLEGMKFGGIFVIGSGHLIVRNRLININTAHCNDTQAQYGCVWKADEPDMLRSGIYLSTGAARPDPARDISIEGNTITGWGMRKYCVEAAPGIQLKASRIHNNVCSDR